MSKSPTIGQVIRKLLLESDDGLTIKELSVATGRTQDVIISALARTYGCYIGGWRASHMPLRAKSAVYYCIVVPTGVPNPDNGSLSSEHLEAHRKSSAQRAAELKDMRKKQLIANAKMRAERDAERLAHRERKEQAKAEALALKAEERVQREERKRKRLETLQPAAPEGYKPAKTVWVTPPPWSH